LPEIALRACEPGTAQAPCSQPDEQGVQAVAATRTRASITRALARPTRARPAGVVVNAERPELEAQRGALIMQSVDFQRRLLEIKDRILEVRAGSGAQAAFGLGQG